MSRFRTTAPIDSDGNPIQVLSLNEDKAHQITIAGTTARNSTAFDTDTPYIEIYSDVDCYVRQGTSGVNATTNDHFLPSGLLKALSLGGSKTVMKTHIAVIQVSSGGTLYISEME